MIVDILCLAAIGLGATFLLHGLFAAFGIDDDRATGR